MRTVLDGISCDARLSLRLLALVVVSIFALTGCRHRDFLYELPSNKVPVTVEFDWTDEPDASAEGMTVYFFRVSPAASRAIVYDFIGRDGGNLSLSPGVYAAICHNNDPDCIGFVGADSFYDFGIRLNDNRASGWLNGPSVNAFKSGEERIAHSSQPLWVGSIASFEIKADDSPSSPAQPRVVRFEMQNVVSRYTFFIHEPENYDKSIAVTASLSGLSGVVHPGRGMTGEETVTHLFNMAPLADGTLCGEFLTFGHCGGRSMGSRAGEAAVVVPHIMVIQATMPDGEKWTITRDVSDQIHTSEVTDCEIHLRELSFPEPGNAGGGIAPSVGGWTGSQENVGM